MASLYAGGRAARYAAQNQPQGPVLSFAEQQAQKAAKDAGFSSAAEQTTNRIMRNQLEAKATAANMPLEEAYKLAGPDLTNTAALQEAWNKIPSTPIAAQQEAPAATAAAPKVDEADQVTKKAEETLSVADQLKIFLDDWERRQAAAAERSEQLRIQSQKTFAANMERSQMTPNLQIMPATGTPKVAGTEGFKGRRTVGGTVMGSILSGLNLGQPTAMNV